MSLDVSLTEEPCPHCGRGDEVFQANITHNLNKMANAAGIYEACWRPEEIGAKRAKDLIVPLRAGIALMKGDPAHFKQFEPANRWGTYDNFIPWLDRYLAACEAWPEAVIHVSR